jgi:hypothetical protein
MGKTDQQLSTNQEQPEPTSGVDDPEIRDTIKVLTVTQNYNVLRAYIKTSNII